MTEEDLGSLTVGLQRPPDMDTSSAEFTLREVIDDWFLVRNGPFRPRAYAVKSILRELAEQINRGEK